MYNPDLGKPDDQDRSRRAVLRARSYMPLWTSVIRSITRNPRMRVELTAGQPRTDNKTVWIRVPPELGDDIDHDAALCGRRDLEYIQMCPLCKLEEFCFIQAIHECGHCVKGTFNKPSDTTLADWFTRAVRALYDGDDQSKRAYKLRQRIEKADPVYRETYLAMAFLVSPWLKFLVNAVEDVRINAEMMQDREGTRIMFAAMHNEIFGRGIKNPDGSLFRWNEAPLNSQVAIGVYCKQSGSAYQKYLSPEVVADLDSPEIRTLTDEVDNLTSIYESYNLSLRLYEALRLKGYFREEDDPEDEPQDEPQQQEESSEQDQGDDASQSGGDTDDNAASDDTGTDSSQGGADDDSGSNTDDDNNDAETGDKDTDEDGEQEDSGEEGGSSDDTTEESEEDDGKEGEESAEESDGDSAGDSADGEADEADNSDAGAGSDGEQDASSESESASGAGDSSGPSEKQEGLVEVTESNQQDSGDGGQAWTGKEPDKMGDLEEVERLFNLFGQHDQEPGEDTDSETEELIEIAIVQADLFDRFSDEVRTLNVFTFDEVEKRQQKFKCWGTSDYGYQTPPVTEAIVAPALLHLRRVFSDNKRGANLRHLKKGRVDTRVLGKRVPVEDPRLFQRKKQPGKKDYFVVIGIDVSSSTGGYSHRSAIVTEKGAVKAQAEMLHRLGVPFAVYAHSASSQDVEMFEIKGPKEPWNDKIKVRLDALVPYSYNLDGHALEFYRKLVEKSTATERLVMFYTDGELNMIGEEYEIFAYNVDYAKKHNITVAAVEVGVETGIIQQLGCPGVRIDTVNDVPKVVRFLETLLT